MLPLLLIYNALVLTEGMKQIIQVAHNHHAHAQEVHTQLLNAGVVNYLLDGIHHSLYDASLMLSPQNKSEEYTQILMKHLAACTSEATKNLQKNRVGLKLSWRNQTVLKMELTKAFKRMEDQMACIESKTKGVAHLEEMAALAKLELTKKKLHRICGANLRDVVSRSFYVAENEVRGRPKKGLSFLDDDDLAGDANPASDDSAANSEVTAAAATSGGMPHVEMPHDFGGRRMKHLNLVQNLTNKNYLISIGVSCTVALHNQIRIMLIESPLTDPGSTCELPFCALSPGEKAEQAKLFNRSALFEETLASDKLKYGSNCDDSAYIKRFTDAFRLQMKSEHFF